MNHGWIYHDRIDRSTAGVTVLHYYSQRYAHSTVQEWQARIEQGQVRLNDRPVTAETRLQPGQRLSYHRPPWQEPTVPLDFEILYEDADLLVVAKPSELPVLPGGGFVEHTVLWQLQQRYPDQTPVPIHRLGRGTSGLLLLARSPLAKTHLSQQLRDRTLRKTYRALIAASALPDRLIVNQAIGKLPHPTLGYIYAATESGFDAHSEIEVIQRDRTSTLLNVTILTGRPHQIRIHLSAIGYPLLGDPLYTVGGIPRLETNPITHKIPVPGDCGYALHAYQLEFVHPRSQQPLHLTCIPPVPLRKTGE
ncbi:MAG: RluA family pseudouridine synthase [Leptolyngbyaceae cyanobacterium SL_7_1]|nr:RluA family pseudouridine synthase [Leptolyngbyaceae cyanobacterium SL_7_1]